MTPQELYQAFLSGKDISPISLAAARRLLDQARSALLTVGRKLKSATTGTASEAKKALIEAHDQLQRAGIADGNEAVYNSAQPIEGQLFGSISAGEAVEQFQKYRALTGRPRNLDLDRVVAGLAGPVKAHPAPARVPTAAPARPTAAPAKASTRPTPPATRPESTEQYLARRVSEQIAARKSLPTKPAPAKPEPTGLETTGISTLLNAAAGRAGAEHVAAAQAELTRRGWRQSGKSWTRNA